MVVHELKNYSFVEGQLLANGVKLAQIRQIIMNVERGALPVKTGDERLDRIVERIVQVIIENDWRRNQFFRDT